MKERATSDQIYSYLLIEGVIRLSREKFIRFNRDEWEQVIFPKIIHSCTFKEREKIIAKGFAPTLLFGFLEQGYLKLVSADGIFEIEKETVTFLSEIYSL